MRRNHTVHGSGCLERITVPDECPFTKQLPPEQAGKLCSKWDREYGDWCYSKGFVRNNKWNWSAWDRLTPAARAELERIYFLGQDRVTRQKLGFKMDE